MKIRHDEIQPGDTVILSDGNRVADEVVPCPGYTYRDGRSRVFIVWRDESTSEWLAGDTVEVKR